MKPSLLFDSRRVLPRLSSALLSLRSLVVVFLLSGCAVSWVSAYAPDAVERSTEISKSVFKIYQDLLSIEAAKRKAAVLGPLSVQHGDAESMMRLHLLKEQARPKNDESAMIAENLLESWLAFSVSHRSDDVTALSDRTLANERIVLERHLRAAFVAEEAKRQFGSAR